MDETETFSRLSTVVNSQSAEIQKILNSCKVSCNIPPVSAFEERYSIKNNPPAKDPSFNRTQSSASIPELKEAFRCLEKLPPCFVKTVRKHSHQSNMKSNSSRRGAGDIHSSSSNLSNASSTTKLNLDESVTTSDHLFVQCLERMKNFEKMLKATKENVQSTLKQHKDNVQDSRCAFEDLEKMVPSGLDNCAKIFNEKEEMAISNFREEIDALICMQENKDMYPNAEMPDDDELNEISKLAGDLMMT